MPDSKIKKYFEEHSHKYTDNALVSKLREAGFTDDEIQQTLNERKDSSILWFESKIPQAKSWFRGASLVMVFLTWFTASQGNSDSSLFFYAVSIIPAVLFGIASNYEEGANAIGCFGIFFTWLFLYIFVIPGVCLGVMR